MIYGVEHKKFIIFAQSNINQQWIFALQQKMIYRR